MTKPAPTIPPIHSPPVFSTISRPRSPTIGGALRAAPIAAAVDALAGARMIYVFGTGGGSTALADEMRFRLGWPVASYQDGLLQRMVAAPLSREHVMVALSVTGQTPEMVESCRIAREYGARVIALTAPASPLAQLADWLIPIIANETDFIYKNRRRPATPC